MLCALSHYNFITLILWQLCNKTIFVSLSLSLIRLDGCGYLEDHRPSSNCDPYSVTETIVRLTVTGWAEFDMDRLKKG